MRGQQANEKIQRRYTGLTTKEGRWNGQIRLLEQNLDLPLRVRKSTVWAVWNDLFHPDVPDSYIVNALAVIADSRHTFLLLTKRPERMKEILNHKTVAADVWVQSSGGIDGSHLVWPLPNLWLGVTAENQEQADKRIPVLLQIPAAVRYVSVEPCLGPVDIHRYLRGYCPPGCPEKMAATFGFSCPGYCYSRDDTGIDWIICGGESGFGARPLHPDWVRSLRDQCQTSGIPYFFKQWGEWIWKYSPLEDKDRFFRVGKKVAGRLLDGRTWDEIPESDS